MRENLIAVIKGFQAKQTGEGESGRNEITLGGEGEITLTFGYGYHDGDKVVVWLFTPGDASNSYTPIERDMHVVCVEEAVDEFLAFYKLS